LAVAGIAVIAAGCSSGTEAEAVSTTEQAVEIPGVQHDVQLSLALPQGAALNKIALGATQSVSLGDRVQVFGDVFSNQGGTTVGNTAKTANLFANGVATLRENAVISGNVVAKSLDKRPSATISGTTTLTNTMPPTTAVSWTVTVRDAFLGDVQVGVDTSRDLIPGKYGHFSVDSRSTVTLHSGVYQLTDFMLQPQARLLIDSSQGPVQIVVDGGFTYRGSIVSATANVPQVLFAVRGPSALVEAPFTGALLAPQAAVRFQAALPKGHRAVVYGATVTLEPDTKIGYYPFDWTTTIGGSTDFNPIPSNATRRDLLENGLGLTLDILKDGTGKTSSSGTSTTTRTFTLRQDQTVGGGVIGNGTVTFRYRDGSGPWVTCTYKGQSSVAAPSTAAELIKGTHLVFQSCSDGRPSGAGRTGTQFELSATPSPGYPVTLKSPMLEPRSCDDDMELLSPDQTRQMRANFDWSKAKKVDATTPDRRPALYYAWIYIRNKDEALALKKLYIHVLGKPLFDDELLRFAGRCGVFTNPGDGTGQFVPVLIPGATYNKLIDALTSGDIQGDRTIFDAVIIRTDVPSAARNANNSVNLDVLGKVGFHYLSYDPNPFANPSTMKLDGGAARVLVGALEWVGQAAKDVGEVVTGLLNELDQLIRGEVNLTFYMQGLTGDAPFKGPNTGANPFGPDLIMTRGWGPQGGHRLAADGMQVKVLQRLLGLPIPTTAQDDTDIDGVARIDATDGSSSRGSGLCVEMRTDAALITDFLMATEMCDLRGYVPAGVAPYGGAFPNPEVSEFQFSFSSAKTNYVLNIDNTRLMGLYQADDVYQYTKHVIGFDTPRARILSGMWASTFTKTNDDGTKKLFTPCMNFPNHMTDAIVGAAAVGGAVGGGVAGGVVGTIVPGVGTVAGAAVGAAVGAISAGTFAAVIGNTDIVMSTESKLHKSRAVMSHEYGHYEFCALLNDANSDAVDHVVWASLIDGNNINVPLRYTNEAFADFFMGQVTGGADYNWGNGTLDSVSDFFCDKNASGKQCWEENLDGTSGKGAFGADEGHRQIGRVATLLHDVFDGQHAARASYAPTDADSFASNSAGQLLYSADGYGNVDEALERVHAPGSAVRTLASDLAFKMSPWFAYDLDEGKFKAAGNAIDGPKILSAVNHAMTEGGANWCDRCRVFALHEPRDAMTDFNDLKQTFEFCKTNSNITAALAEPAPASSNGLAADTCTPCPAGTASDAAGVCQVCVGTVVNGECVQCQADATLDAATITSADLPFSAVFDVNTSAPGDKCPNVFWLEIKNASSALSFAKQIFGTLEPTVYSDADCSRPYTLISATPAVGYFAETPLTSTGVPTCPQGGLCPEPCDKMPEHVLTAAEAAPSVFRFGSPVMSNARMRVKIIGALDPGN